MTAASTAFPSLARSSQAFETGSPSGFNQDTQDYAAFCALPPEKRTFYKVADGKVVETKLDESNWQQPVWDYDPRPHQVADVTWDDVPLQSPIPDLAGDGPFKPTWDSLLGYEAPDWYRDAKFGIWVHWSHDRELRIWLAYNSWMAEGQWHSFRPSELGFVENMRTSWSQASAASIGSWSTEKYLPMAVVENIQLGVAWFWQIKHNGSWYWELSNLPEKGIRASDVYAYLGGPDQLHSQAWKNLEPGKTYRTVPVAIGCVRGGFQEAVQALTSYREQVCVRPRPAQKITCPVIFNDYMNCLWGDPTEEKELPLIDAAAEAGCEYFVIDAGWYAERNEDWSSTVGAWQPSKTRWPHGLRFVLDRIREKGMVPGLWLEPEVAGKHSALAAKPDAWFLMRHGQRVTKNSRLLLDFRNPEVRSYLEALSSD